MKKLLVFTLALLFLPLLNGCVADETVDATSTPSPAFTPTPPGTCTGQYTGISVRMPNNSWKCTIDTNDDVSETFLITSSLFTITITTQEHDPYCDPSSDISCVQTAFYENNAVSLTKYSSSGELKEIYGLRRLMINGQSVPVTFSIKYQGMDHKNLAPDEKQELIDFLDSITYGK